MKRNGLCSGASGNVLENWRNYLAEHPVDNHGDVDSLLELLYHFFTEYEPVENEELRRQFAELEHQLMSSLAETGNFCRETVESLMTIVSSVCAECERVAFMEGVKVGARLILELTEDQAP